MLRRHTWQRSPKPPILGRHPIFPTPQPLFKVYPTPHPTFPVTSNAHPHCPFCCLVSLAEWVIAPHLMCILFNDILLWIYKCRAMAQLYQKDFYVWFMQQGIKFTEVWHRIRFFVGTLIWYHTHKHTNAHKTMHSTLRASRLHTHIYIHLHPLLCAQSRFITLYHTEWITDIKNWLSTMRFLFKNHSLVKIIYLLIRCYKTSFFLWNTNNAVIEMV